MARATRRAQRADDDAAAADAGRTDAWQDAATEVRPIRVGGAVVAARVIAPDTLNDGVAGEAKVTRGSLDFAEVTSGIESMSKALVESLQKVAPQKWSVEFNVGVAIRSGKLTALFFDTDVTGSIKVVLQWSRDGKPDDAADDGEKPDGGA